MAKFINVKFSFCDEDGNVTYKKGVLNSEFIVSVMDTSEEEGKIGVSQITMSDGQIYDVMDSIDIVMK